MSYFLAIDGGGTKTEAICADENGAVIGEGLSGPTNLTSTSYGAASFNLIEAIRQSIENLPEIEQKNFEILVIGLAGIDSQKEHDDAFAVFSRAIAHYRIKKILLVNDSLIALENGTDSKDAVILISGTGSVCLGQSSDGKTAKASGMDFLLADQGSGYAIGRSVLREAVRSFDGRAPKSVIEELVCDYFKIPTVADLKNEVYNPLLTKIEVADLAPICSTAFEQGDEVAKRIFDKIIEDLIIMLEAVVRRMEFEQKEFDCVCSGSVNKLQYISEGVNKFISKKYPQAKVIIPGTRPVFGALKMALREGINGSS
jgi:N-acetylglucosamine kinase-like BadF-type ATPase